MKHAARDPDFEALRRALDDFHGVPPNQTGAVVLDLKFREVLKISRFVYRVKLQVLRGCAASQERDTHDLECPLSTDFLSQV